MTKKKRGKSTSKHASFSACASDRESDDDDVNTVLEKNESYKKRAGNKQVPREVNGVEERNQQLESNVSEEERTLLEQQVLKENSVIANHVQFLKGMKGIIPRDDALSRLFTLICNGPQLANGDVFSDITLMQTTLDFVIGLIIDPSLNLQSINNVVRNMKDGFPLYSVRLMNQNLYCNDNFLKTEFTVGKLNEMKQSVHLKYCVSTLMSTLLTVSFAKRFRREAKVNLYSGTEYCNNCFYEMLKRNSHDRNSMLILSIKAFVSLLSMYGHVYWYDENFLTEFWEEALESNVAQMGTNRRAENKDLMMGSFGAVQTMIYNLLDNVGNCISYYAWLCAMDKICTKELLVTQICETVVSELHEAREVVSAVLNNHARLRSDEISGVNEYMEEMKYSIVHHFGKNKCTNVKFMMAQRLQVVMRD
jgi:hypothetical protein